MSLQLSELRVLLVDDQYESRKIIRAMMQNFGLTQSFEAASTDDALAFLAEARDMVDLMLTDIVMPGDDGLELFLRCRKNWPDLPTIVFSGATDAPTILRAKTYGVSAFLARPFSTRQLKSKIEAVLQRQKARPAGLRTGQAQAAIG